jgi:hypothetical protein
MKKQVRMLQAGGLLAAAMLCAAGAHAEETTGIFEPAKLKGPAKGVPNEVMVFGTAHLSQLKPPFQPASLSLLNARLAAWKPQIIAIEALSGMQCDHARRFPHRYKDTVTDYCWDPAPAKAATGLDVPAAAAEAERLLAAWPASPTPAQRRHLAAVFLAGGERASSLVQWLRLPEAERHAGDGLDAALVAVLEKQRARRNEDTLIAAPLAAALGLERVVAMDDHTSDTMIEDEKGFGEALKKAWDNPAVARRRKTDADFAPRLGDPEAVLEMVWILNEPSQAKLVFDSDFGAALEEGSAQKFGRNYVGYWETRNLRMASNIRDAIAARPGSRTLVIVGASHKGYLEAYLNQMHDIRIVNALQVLR